LGILVVIVSKQQKLTPMHFAQRLTFQTTLARLLLVNVEAPFDEARYSIQ
jgi:hypothetical protein